MWLYFLSNLNMGAGPALPPAIKYIPTDPYSTTVVADAGSIELDPYSTSQVHAH